VTQETRHLGVRIERDAGDVYAFCADPANLPRWAAGLSGSIERVGHVWFADSPMGRVQVEFAPRNPFGVLDHLVTLPGGLMVENPLRVLRDGTGCDVVFTLRRRDGVEDDDFEADAAAVVADLEALKRLLEAADDDQRR